MFRSNGRKNSNVTIEQRAYYSLTIVGGKKKRQKEREKFEKKRGKNEKREGEKNSEERAMGSAAHH